MISTTSANMECRAINAVAAKQQILMLALEYGDSKQEETINAILRKLLKIIDELPTVDTIEGKKVRRAYYPRVMVRDNCVKDGKPFFIGGNRHHKLEIRKTKHGSYLAFLNIQCMVGTDYADEGYTFVGEKPFAEMGDDTELVPFDRVWVEESEE